MVRRWKIIVYTWEFAEILAFLRSPAAEARELRRVSPFCGILTPHEIAQAFVTAPPKIS